MNEIEKTCENCMYEMESEDGLHCRNCIHNTMIQENFEPNVCEWKLTEEDALETLNNAILEGNSIVISPRDFGVYKSAFQKVEVE